MSSTLTLMQVASVLGVPMLEVRRLVRQRALAVARKQNKIWYFDVAAVQQLIRSAQLQEQFNG